MEEIIKYVSKSYLHIPVNVYSAAHKGVTLWKQYIVHKTQSDHSFEHPLRTIHAKKWFCMVNVQNKNVERPDYLYQWFGHCVFC